MPGGKNVYKVHVSFEAIYYVEAGSLDEARCLLRTQPLGDNLLHRGVSLLHIVTDGELEALKEKGTLIIGKDIPAGGADTD